MKIDAALVVELRKERSWSQEELAVASGLNLRTVQRIEREGSISLQSKKALAAAFEVEATSLDYIEPTCVTQYEYKTVVLKSDATWISGWGKKKFNDGPFEIDSTINDYAAKGWRVHTITYGNSVHGGAGQAIVVFERSYLTEIEP